MELTSKYTKEGWVSALASNKHSKQLMEVWILFGITVVALASSRHPWFAVVAAVVTFSHFGVDR